jgi:hypothetical protein
VRLRLRRGIGEHVRIRLGRGSARILELAYIEYSDKRILSTYHVNVYRRYAEHLLLQQLAGIYIVIIAFEQNEEIFIL